MRVLQIGSSWFSYQLSGLERYYVELVNRLPRLGVKVTGLVYELKDPPAVPGLEMVSFGTQNKSVARQFVDQRRIVREQLRRGTDIVVSHCTPSLFPSLRSLRDVPLICHFHGPRCLERVMEGAGRASVRLSRYIEDRVYARTHHAIVLSQYMKGVLIEEYRFPEERISVIPGGVNLEQFRVCISRNEARLQLGLPLDRPILVTVRRLEKRMGLLNLVDAMTEVVRDQPDVLLLIGGKGSLRNQLEQHVTTKGLSAHVRILGAIDEKILPLIYKAADLSIVPTVDYEGFGLILVESLAAGTPALGTPFGAIPEVLGGLSSSLILEGFLPSQLAAGISESLAGERVLPTAERCENYAAEKYAWPSVVSKVHSVYRSVLNGTSQLQVFTV